MMNLLFGVYMVGYYRLLCRKHVSETAFVLVRQINLPDSTFVVFSYFCFAKFLVCLIIGNNVLPKTIYQFLAKDNINVQNDKNVPVSAFSQLFYTDRP